MNRKITMRLGLKHASRANRFKRANSKYITEEKRNGNFIIFKMEVPDERFLEILGCKIQMMDEELTITFDGKVNPHL